MLMVPTIHLHLRKQNQPELPPMELWVDFVFRFFDGAMEKRLHGTGLVRLHLREWLKSTRVCPTVMVLRQEFQVTVGIQVEARRQ